MKRIFVKDVSGETFKIGGVDARHLAYPLRAQCGDTITAVDEAGNSAVVELIDFDKESITVRRISEVKPVAKGRKIILAVCLPKHTRFDNIIEKATELGVDKIIPILSDRTVARPFGVRMPAKLERWNRIAKEAAEQCARDTIPEVAEIEVLEFWLKDILPLDDNTLLLFCWEGEQTTTVREVLSANKDKNIIVLIGPEGGFSEREVAAIKKAGGVSVTLGKRVLKTDTAAISVMAMINYESM